MDSEFNTAGYSLLYKRKLIFICFYWQACRAHYLCAPTLLTSSNSAHCSGHESHEVSCGTKINLSKATGTTSWARLVSIDSYYFGIKLHLKKWIWLNWAWVRVWRITLISSLQIFKESNLQPQNEEANGFYQLEEFIESLTLSRPRVPHWQVKWSGIRQSKIYKCPEHLFGS